MSHELRKPLQTLNLQDTPNLRAQANTHNIKARTSQRPLLPHAWPATYGLHPRLWITVRACTMLCPSMALTSVARRRLLPLRSPRPRRPYSPRPHTNTSARPPMRSGQGFRVVTNNPVRSGIHETTVPHVDRILPRRPLRPPTNRQSWPCANFSVPKSLCHKILTRTAYAQLVFALLAQCQ